MSILQLRLKNCIQTILDLEPGIKKAGGNYFDKDFTSLKFYLSQVDNMELGEEEVLKLESVTADFLAEIGISSAWKGTKKGLLQ